MKTSIYSGWIFLAFCALSAVDISTAQTGVCYSSVLSALSTTRYISSSYSTSYSCGFLWLSRCRRTLYRSSPQTQYSYGYRRVFGCCPGYHQLESTCQKIGEVRLVGGASRYEGRVEIFLNGQWGTVCNDSWSQTEAHVVCTQLGYNNSQFTPLAFYGDTFGPGTGAIHLDDVQCIGNETLLTSCSYPTGHNCGHHQDAGVRCPQCAEASIRLIDGSSVYEGRVEVCRGGGWGTVCDDSWTTEDARVVCRQLGYLHTQHTPLAFTFAHFGRGTGPIVMDDVLCSGTETNLTSCTHITNHNCVHSEDAGVRCSQCIERSIRLHGGSSVYEGRVEVCLGGGWGTVCDDLWSSSDARVVCRQLGYLNTQYSPLAFSRAHFGEGTGAISMDDVQCSGTEFRLTSCTHITNHNCGHYEDAGVRCSQCAETSVRLSNGTSVYEGRVEVCLGGGWGTVCDTSWNVDDARVVCRQLGYENTQYAPLAFSRAQFGQGTGAISMDRVQCSGTETLLTSCSHATNHSCTHIEDAGVRCRQCPETDIRLRGGSTPLQGRVEVCLGGGWGTVCDDGWDFRDATVACRQLAFNSNGARAFSRAFFGQGTGLPIAMDNLGCSSTETHLVNCTYLNANAVRSCSHREDAGVRCLPLPPRTAPSRVTATALSSTSLRVSWVPPVARDWNGQMTGFKITIRNIESSTLSTITVSNSAATSQRVLSLHPYYRYQCRVAAYNSGGNGPFSSLVTVELFQDRPSGFPQNVTSTTHSSRSFSLSWSPPLPEERNGIIIRYAVQISDSNTGQNYFAQTTNLNLTFPTGSVAIVPYRTYILQVAAETAVGRGPYSTDTTVHTPEDSPTHFPQNLAEDSVNSTSFRLQWNPPPPEHHNGEITGYRVNITERETGMVFQYLTPTTQLTVTGLHPHYLYECTVSAITVAEGPYSAALVVQTHEAAPSAPPQDISVASVTSTSIALSWSPPHESSQNGLIRRYIVTVVNDNSGVTLWRVSTRLGITIDAVQPFTRYSVHVAAQTIETGPFSSAVEVTTLADLPGAVNNFMLEAINATTLRATWEEPSQTNGNITDYQLTIQEQNSNSVIITSTLREFTWYGLRPFYIYRVNITAATSAGRGSSAQSQIRMPEAAPSGTPLGVSAVASDPRTLSLTWELPEEEHRNGRIRRYGINVVTQDGDGETRSYTTQSRTLEVSNLHPHYTYTLFVSAITVGTGPSANITIQLPEDVPSQAPPNFSAAHDIASPNSLNLTWAALFLEHQNGVIRGYRVTAHPSRGRGDSLEVNVTSDLEAFQLSGLSTNTVYNISIAAFTRAGPGPSATLQILLLPRVPTSIEVTRISATEIHVNWVASEAEAYFIRHRPVRGSRQKRSEDNDDSVVVVVETRQTSYQITGLSPGISYAVSVAAGNSAGRGRFSEETIAELFDSSSFILHMSGPIECEPWLEHGADTKQRAMLEEMSSQLMLNYSSSLNLNHIAQTHLSCQMDTSDVVILRGTLVGTAERSGAELHQMLQAWIDAGQTFQITGTSLELLACSTYPESANTCFEVATTPAVVSNSEFQLDGVSLYGIIGGGVALLMIIALCVLVLVVTCRRRRKKRKNFAITNRMNLHVGMDTLGKFDESSSAAKKELELYSELDDEGHIYEDPNTLFGTNCGQQSAEPTKNSVNPASKLRPALPTPTGLSKGGASLAERDSSSDPRYTFIGQQPPQLIRKDPLEYEFPKTKCDPQQAENSADIYDDCLLVPTQPQPTGRSTASESYDTPKKASSAAHTPEKCTKKVAAESYDRPRQKPLTAQAPLKPATDTKKVNGMYDKPRAKPKEKISADATKDQPLYFSLKTQNMLKDSTYQEVKVTSKSINADGSFQEST